MTHIPFKCIRNDHRSSKRQYSSHRLARKIIYINLDYLLVISPIAPLLLYSHYTLVHLLLYLYSTKLSLLFTLSLHTTPTPHRARYFNKLTLRTPHSFHSIYSSSDFIYPSDTDTDTMFTKSIITLASTLAAISPAQAAPLLGSPLKGLTSTSALAHGELAVFADAWLAASTGGAYQTCDAITGQLGLNLNLNLGLTLSSTTSFVNQIDAWAVGQCWNAYRESSLPPSLSFNVT